MDAYLNPPLVRANIVQGVEGVFTDSQGSSRGISNDSDRSLLLELRKLSDVLVTDGETARKEKYRVPMMTDLAVITKTGYQPIPNGSRHRYLELRDEPVAAVRELISLGYERILLEVGPNVLAKLIAGGMVDELCLTNSGFSRPMLSTLGIRSAEKAFETHHSDTTFTIWREIQA